MKMYLTGEQIDGAVLLALDMLRSGKLEPLDISDSLYSMIGPSGVYRFAEKADITSEWRECEHCERETPSLITDEGPTCFLCGWPFGTFGKGREN